MLLRAPATRNIFLHALVSPVEEFETMTRNLILSLALGTGVLLAQPPNPGGGSAPSSQPTSPTAQPGMGTPNGPAGNAPATTPAKVDDKKFAKEAAIGGLTEVQLGKLAQQKASSEAVKQFAQKMIDDHSKAGDQLKQVASSESLSLPDSLDPKHQAAIDKLSKLSGPEFDKAYAKDMVKDHEKDVSEFQAESQGGTDANVKQFASQTLPVLQQHLELAKDLNKTVKKGSK
jgi:putative membrane protein